MKTVVQCINCKRIYRRSEAYHVKLEGYHNINSLLEKPNIVEFAEKTWLCKNCAPISGYKVHTKKEVSHVDIIQEMARKPKKAD